MKRLNSHGFRRGFVLIPLDGAGKAPALPGICKRMHSRVIGYLVWAALSLIPTRFLLPADFQEAWSAAHDQPAMANVLEKAKTGKIPISDSRFARLEEWRQSIDLHTPGKSDLAAVKIGSWPESDLVTVISLVKELLALPFDRLDRMPKMNGKSIPDMLGIEKDEDKNTVLKRSALLHTDITLLQLDAAPGSVVGAKFALTKDGKSVLKDAGRHLEWARLLLDSVSPNPSQDVMVKQWYIATTATALKSGRRMNAEKNLSRALVLFPSDPLFLFYAGILHETYASSASQNAVPPPGAAFSFGSKKSELELARKFYQQAVESRPDFAEARLRLGRVIGLSGDHKQAIAELRRAGEDMKDPQLSYYAALFLGHEQARLGHKPEAREQFMRAATLYPNAQSPLISLGWLALNNGDAQEASLAVDRVFTLPVRDSLPEEPWWDYGSDPVRNAAELVAEMRKAFGGLPR